MQILKRGYIALNKLRDAQDLKPLKIVVLTKAFHGKRNQDLEQQLKSIHVLEKDPDSGRRTSIAHDIGQAGCTRNILSSMQHHHRTSPKEEIHYPYIIESHSHTLLDPNAARAGSTSPGPTYVVSTPAENTRSYADFQTKILHRLETFKKYKIVRVRDTCFKEAFGSF